MARSPRSFYERLDLQDFDLPISLLSERLIGLQIGLVAIHLKSLKTSGEVPMERIREIAGVELAPSAERARAEKQDSLLELNTQANTLAGLMWDLRNSTPDYRLFLRLGDHPLSARAWGAHYREIKIADYGQLRFDDYDMNPVPQFIQKEAERSDMFITTSQIGLAIAGGATLTVAPYILQEQG